jgi:hypothetical protein
MQQRLYGRAGQETPGHRPLQQTVTVRARAALGGQFPEKSVDWPYIVGRGLWQHSKHDAAQAGGAQPFLLQWG